MFVDEITIDKLNEVYLRFNGEIGQCMELKAFSSFYATSYKYHPAFKARIWDGKLSWYNMKDKTVPIGLLPELYKYAERYGYTLKLNFDIGELVPKQLDDDHLYKFYDIILKDSEFYPRDYQHEAVRVALNNRRGTLSSATASGKSFVIYLIVRYLLSKGEKVMIIVPSVSLVNQIFSDFVDYGWYQCGHNVEKLYSGERPTFGKDVLITTYQSLMKRPAAFFANYTAMINDECQQTKSTELQKIAKKCVNAKTRLGFTGTLPKEPADVYNIKGMLGPNLFTLKSKTLIDQGILSKIKVVGMLLKYPEPWNTKGRYRQYQDEVDLVEECPDRMNVFKYIFDNMPDGQNSIILVNHLKHLDALVTFLSTEISDKYVIYVVHGGVDPKERERIRTSMNNEKNVIVVATYATMSTGINVKRIHNVILGSSSKSEIRVLQTIGRGLRTHEDKDGVIVWDLCDDFSFENRNGNLATNYLYKHFEERYKYYMEQEFPCFMKNFEL
jgi:superfamily II DNA or RNA helicase